ncbi:MAG: hypothetical protein JXB05_28430, partial [Myxococcaceae bacterium]|nr:hypothetical protein [Myxococcaceae bacterium]
PPAPVPESPPPPRPKRPRIDWARLLRHTSQLDVLQCPCGGRRRVLAAVTSPAVAEKVLRDIGRLPPHPPLATGPPPPQLSLPL